MCLRSEYDLHARTRSRHVSSEPRRSLIEVLRDLFRPRRPQIAEAEVIPLRADGAARSERDAGRRRSKAA